MASLLQAAGYLAAIALGSWLAWTPSPPFNATECARQYQRLFAADNQRDFDVSMSIIRTYHCCPPL